MTTIEGKTWRCPNCEIKSILQYVKERVEDIYELGTIVECFPQGSLVKVVSNQSTFRCSFCLQVFTTDEIQEIIDI